MTVFDTKAKAHRHRNEVNVSLRLTGSDAPMEATVFTHLDERASDLLNDNRSFIPVRLSSGETLIVAKSQIASMSERAAEKASDGKSKFRGEDFSKEADTKFDKAFDPYAMLRISPDASLEEIRSAYKARIKAVHPDALASLGLDEDLAKAAVLATQKVNYAYQRILRERDVRKEKSD